MLRTLNAHPIIKYVTLLTLITFLPVAGETINLKDGSKITGTITEQTATQLVVKTLYGTLTIDKANIEYIDFGAPKKEQPQKIQSAPAQTGQYDRGYREGHVRGYQEGLELAKAQKKSERITGSLVGWLTLVLVLVVAIIASSPSSY